MMRRTRKNSGKKVFALVKSNYNIPLIGHKQLRQESLVSYFALLMNEYS